MLRIITTKGAIPEDLRGAWRQLKESIKATPRSRSRVERRYRSKGWVL